MNRALSDTVLGDRTGQIVREKYRLLRLIGSGGMGAVYEAEHVVVGRRFALKFLQPDLVQNEDALARFRREARAAGSLESEHIVGVTDFDGAEDGTPFLVMEYLAGESLAELLAREGPLPVPRVVAALLQVCQGLAVAHAAGIIHRDLKPENLFVVRGKDGADLVKILDFGIAKLARPDPGGSVTRTGAAMGTPFYMAPEQARGERNIDERVDVYALGVILYELLSGQKPHPGDSYNSILAHILGQTPAPLAALRPGLPAPLAALVHRALANDPKERPASAAELGRELAPFAGVEVAAVRSQFELRVMATGTPTVSAVTSERKSSHGLFVVLALAVATASGAAVWSRQREPVPAASSSVPPSASIREAPPATTRAATAAASVATASAVSVSPGPVADGDSGHVLGQPLGRPALSATAKRAAPKGAAAAAREPSKAAVVPANPAPESGRGRVTFDTQNPYE
jgi:serine/threonine protein kinase